MNIGNRNKKKKGLNLMMKLLMLSLIDPGDRWPSLFLLM